MTTWEDCSYQDDLLCKLVQLIPKDDLWATYLWKTFGYENFDYTSCGMKNPDEILTGSGMKKAYPLISTQKNEWFMKNLKDLASTHDRVLSGNAGIYEFISRTYNFGIECHREYQFGKIRDLTKTMLQVNLLGSLTTPKYINPMINELLLKDLPFKIYANLLQTASAIQHLAFYWRSASQSDKIYKARRSGSSIPIVDQNSISFGRHTTTYTYPGVTMVSVNEERFARKILFIFTNKQIRRLEITLRALSKAIFYYLITYASLPNFQENFMKYLDMFVESMVKERRYNEVARAWDIIFNLQLATIASDITDLSLKLQKEKLYDGKYNKIAEWDTIVRLFENLKESTCIDLLKLYKILPAPDFNPSTGFSKMKAFHEKQHTFGQVKEEYKNKFQYVKLDVAEFEIFQRLQLLRRLYRKFQYLPLSLKEDAKAYLYDHPDSELSHFPRCRPNHLTNEEIKLINFKGEADWENLNTNSPIHYIDKACTPQNRKLASYLDAQEYYNEKVYERNYAAWYIHQSTVPTTDEIRIGFQSKQYSNNQMAFYKPESKKPDPRNFYSATPYQRICMTEFENNVTRYLSHDVASFQSKNPKERAMALSSLLGEENLQIRRKLVFISFDLEKFSPCFNSTAKDLSMKLWLEFFDRPGMAAIRDFYNDVELHYMHQGIHQSYSVKSIDMEGQNGKVNTCYHEDVMAFAVRILRRYGLVNEPAKLAVFIDDGLLALALPLDTTNEKVMEIVKLIDHVYHYFGLHISFDKTFISQKLATFLNEIYLDNEYLNVGFKAFLKLQLAKVTDELSISGKTRALVTMARAAFVNGVLGHLVYSELIKELYALHGKLFQRIDRAVSTQETFLVTVLWIHTPIAMSGLGVPFLCNLEASPSTDPISEFVCASEYLSGATPFLESFLRNIIDQKFRQRSNLAILRAPQAMRVLGHTLTEHKHINLVTKVVQSFSNNPTLNRVLNNDFNMEADSIMNFLGKCPELWELEGAYKMSNINVLDVFIGKFKRSSTILSLLSWRTRLYLINKYKVEEDLVVSDYLSLYRH